MSTPTLKTRLVQFDVCPGRPRENTAVMLDHIRTAVSDGIQLLVFPEMAIPGYLIGDRWEQAAFLRECEACGHAIREATGHLIVVFGNVAMDWTKRNEDGRVRKYNALFVAEHGRFCAPDRFPYPFCIKTLMANYRQFDDSRHFHDLRKLAFETGTPVERMLAPVRTSRAVLGAVLCEDAWDPDYPFSPLEHLGRHDDIQLFINASASPYTFNKNHKRHRIFSAHARRLGRPLLYVNHVGIQNNGKTVFTFDGGSCIYDSGGNVIRLEERFEPACLSLDIPLIPGVAFAPESEPIPDGMADLYTALSSGIRRFLNLCGIQRVVIGASGGIDSAVVAALHRRILPARDLLLVNMPSRYNSATTRDLARTLAERLEVPYGIVPIEESIALTRRQLDGLEIGVPEGPSAGHLKLNTAILENVQARDRSARILAAIAAARGGVFTCNANKSEMTVGYTTLYGDLGGYLAPIGDLWKTQVYQLAEYLNTSVFGRDVIPAGSLGIPPSAELSDGQNVDRGLGDPLCYEYHDRLFESWVEWWNRTTPEEILTWYANGELKTRLGLSRDPRAYFEDTEAFITDLERWWNLYQGMGVAKRIQAPPVLAVKRRAFGFDHREAQMGAFFSGPYEHLKQEQRSASRRRSRSPALPDEDRTRPVPPP